MMDGDELRRRIRGLLDERGDKPIPLAQALGKGRDYLADLWRVEKSTGLPKKDSLSSDFLNALSEHWDIAVEYFLDEAAAKASRRKAPAEPAAASAKESPVRLLYSEPTVPIVGRVGAGAQIEALQLDYGQIEVPSGFAGGAAFEVRGDSCAPVFEDGDIVVVRSTSSAEPKDFLNRFCVVETEGDELGWLKLVRAGDNVPGRGSRYDLESPNPETQIMQNKRIRSVRPVEIRILRGVRR